jgi:DNA helicase-2/ATP-dependent DNA helicase PcrA
VRYGHSFKARAILPEQALDAADGFLEKKAAEVYRLYMKALRDSNALDFDDLLYELKRLLTTVPEARSRWSTRFEHVLIDEYQDTNLVQYEIARELGSGHGTCARPATRTSRSIAGAARWRATSTTSSATFPARPWSSWRRTTARRTTSCAPPPPSSVTTPAARTSSCSRRTATASAFWCSRVQTNRSRRTSSRGASARRWTPAARTPTSRSCSGPTRSPGRFERAMRMHNIPYRIVGGVEFYRRKEIKDLLAYLRVIVNPRDQQALLRIINVPPRGIGPTTVERLLAEAQASSRMLLYVVLDLELPEAIKGRGRKSVADFGTLIAELREHPRQVVANVLLAVLERTGYLEYLTEFGGAEASDRRENVFELMAAVKEYDLSHPDGSLENFLQETSLVQDVDDLGDGEANQVMVMTMHSAKGLEFPVVVMPALEEGVLPHLRAIQENDIEEERRLCYVGITRAREERSCRTRGCAIGSGSPRPASLRAS